MMAKNNKEILSKETAVAVKAELAKYADTYDVEETQKLVKEIVSETVNLQDIYISGIEIYRYPSVR